MTLILNHLFNKIIQRKRSDPITQNRYAYGNNNPNKYADPAGKWGRAGDIYGVSTEDGSSINNLDYKSDLDVVNINAMLESDENLSIMDAKEQYYGKLEKGEINRADEFLRNLGDGNSDRGLEHMINSSIGYQITYGKFSAHDKQDLKNLEEYINAQKKIKEDDPKADIASALFFEHIMDSKMEWSGN